MYYSIEYKLYNIVLWGRHQHNIMVTMNLPIRDVDVRRRSALHRDVAVRNKDCTVDQTVVALAAKTTNSMHHS